MNDRLELLATVTAYLAIAIVGVLALAALWSFTSTLRHPWLPLRRVRRISWQGIDVLIAFFVFYAISVLFHDCANKAGILDAMYGDPSDSSTRSRRLLWTSAVAQPFALALILLGLQQLRGTRFSELGLTARRAGVCFALGFAFWLLLVPLAEGIQYLALFATPQGWSDEHPLSRAAEQPLAISEWLLIFLDAVLLAPLLEEILFRGILLPWQLRSGWEAQATMAFCSLFVAALSGGRDQGAAYNPAPVVFVLIMLPGVFIIPFLTLRRGIPDIEPPASTDPVIDKEKASTSEHKLVQFMWRSERAGSQPGLAIFANGLFFASMHSSVWPSPIPLFLLGTGLAWLAYRTSSLLGSIVLHVLFNAVAALALLLEHYWR